MLLLLRLLCILFLGRKRIKKNFGAKLRFAGIFFSFLLSGGPGVPPLQRGPKLDSVPDTGDHKGRPYDVSPQIHGAARRVVAPYRWSRAFRFAAGAGPRPARRFTAYFPRYGGRGKPLPYHPPGSSPHSGWRISNNSADHWNRAARCAAPTKSVLRFTVGAGHWPARHIEDGKAARPGGRALQGRTPVVAGGHMGAAPTAEIRPGALARQSQAHALNRTSSNFCKPRAQWPGGNLERHSDFARRKFCLDL